MATRDDPIHIPVGDEQISGTLVTPATIVPGVLFLHGWGGTQKQYLARAREIAALGCMCLTVDLRGHEATEAQKETVTREDNLRDALAAYDTLASHQGVDREAVAVVGSSYGGYLAAILSSVRPVRWLALRVPALYRDEDWPMPKQQLKKYGLADYRRAKISPDKNRALAACAAFKGDVLIVESELDDIIPHAVIENYVAAFAGAHSLTYRVIEGADHALSQQPWQQAYTSLLLNWATEMVLGAREEGAAPGVHTRLQPSPRRGPPTAA
jgi:uncharacterized protein